MKQNIGTADRIIRIVAGIAVIAWGIYARNWLGVIGLALAATGLIGWCGLYQLLKINTCSIKR